VAIHQPFTADLIAIKIMFERLMEPIELFSDDFYDNVYSSGPCLFSVASRNTTKSWRTQVVFGQPVRMYVRQRQLWKNQLPDFTLEATSARRLLKHLCARDPYWTKLEYLMLCHIEEAIDMYEGLCDAESDLSSYDEVEEKEAPPHVVNFIDLGKEIGIDPHWRAS
jgi:hypothetical protein